jgi:hypothetical protein
MYQAITPDPDIPCRPGWCLAYVNEAFGVPKVYPTAMASWLASPTQHRDMNFPRGVWVPLWFSLATEPAGHVALLAPDGAVWSTTHPTAHTPTRHPDLADLFRAYSRYNPLTYLGWTEDVEGTRVLAGITAQSLTALEDKEMAIDVDALVERLDSLNKAHHEATREHVNGRIKDIADAVWKHPIDWRDPLTGELQPDTTTPETVLSYVDRNTSRILDARTVVANIPDDLAKEVLDMLAARIGGK